MRLYLAVALLMLAFVAYTEAQEEETIGDKFNEFGRQMTEMGKNIAEQARASYEKAQNSEAAVATRKWFEGVAETIRNGIAGMTQ